MNFLTLSVRVTAVPSCHPWVNFVCCHKVRCKPMYIKRQPWVVTTKTGSRQPPARIKTTFTAIAMHKNCLLYSIIGRLGVCRRLLRRFLRCAFRVQTRNYRRALKTENSKKKKNHLIQPDNPCVPNTINNPYR